MQPKPTENHNTESAPGNTEQNGSKPLIRTCPICSEEIKGKTRHVLYKVEVCGSCYYGFASNRHLAFAIDFLASLFITVSLALAFTRLCRLCDIGYTGRSVYNLAPYYHLLFVSLIAFRDGIRGHSPGKFLMGVQVVSKNTLIPIGLGGSFVRNSPIKGFLLATFFIIAYTANGEYMNVAFLFFLLFLAYMLHKGPRLGDGLAGTKVIWKKHRFQIPFDQRGLLCGACGYNLTGNVSGVCPECGTEAI